MKPRRVARAKTANPLRANPKRAAAPTGALPSRDELLAFLSGEAAPNGEKPAGRVTKRRLRAPSASRAKAEAG